LETILVKGPVLLKVRGECEILGVKFRNTVILYNNNKYLPIEKNNDTIITVKKGLNYLDLEKNKIEQNTIGTKIWDNIINSIQETGRKRIIIIGLSDTGKSTLTLFISNKLISRGFRPLVIDSDIGQGELSPPACIGSRIISRQTIDLAKGNFGYIIFIGNIQPIGYESRIINSIKKVLDKLNTNNNITLINTDGYVGDNEKNYKIELIEKIKPDCIICLGSNDQTIDLFEIIKEKFSKNTNIQILKGQSPHQEIKKNLSERREKRLLKYSTLFKPYARNVIISKKKLNAIYYKDKFFLLKNISYIGNTNKIERNNAIIEDLINDRFFIRNRFVGLSLKEDFEKIIGFGIIKQFNNGFFLIRSSINKFDHIFLSDIKLCYNSNTLPN
jgi:polynucleotide 5'-hydroxyl-kinase GRC3/NOL9